MSNARPARTWRALPAALALVAVLLPRDGLAVEPREGPWRAWLDCAGGHLPFDLEILAGESGQRAWISNGEERIEISMTVEGAGVVFEIPLFDARVDAASSGEGGRLDGVWRRDVGGRMSVEMPFHATAGRAPRFLPAAGAADVPEATPDNRPLAERWTVRFEGHSLSSVGVFHSADDGTVLGTFLNASGDYRYLAGEFRNGRLRLSRFDGGQPYLFDARMQEDGTLAGTFWLGNSIREDWTASPDPDARLADGFAYLRIDPSPDLASLVAFDLDGAPSTLAEMRTPGRALLLEILGTWCPNCHDASKFLTELRDEYGDRGLDVVGLAFQMSSSFQRNAADLRRYRKRNGIEYPLLLASDGAPVAPAEFFPPLSGGYAFPTVLFLDRRGRVRGTYTGFCGPATGADHEAMKRRWRTLIEEILAEGS